MREIINGKRYNTKNAELVATWSNGYGKGDFHNCSEDLYRTAAGNWFIDGEGGPLSAYAESCGSGRTGGRSLVPLDGPGVVEWLERREKYEELEALFPDSIEDA